MADPISLAAQELPVELQLVAACCDIGDVESKAERARPLAAQITDWHGLSRVLRRHQLLGSAYGTLKASGQVPAEVLTAWAEGLQRMSAQALRQARETVRLHQLVTEAGAENLVMKGVSLGQRIYGSLIQKHSGDIDFLVQPEGIEAALNVLQDEGFLPLATGHRMSSRQASAVARHYKEIALINERKEMIDLHWRLVEHPAILKDIQPFEAVTRFAIGNAGEILGLGEADEFAYLCAHAALSDWRRLKWLSDIHAWLAPYNDEQIIALVEHAKSLGADRCALQCLALREVMWGKAMPPVLREQLGSEELSALTQFAIERMTTPYRATSDKDRWQRIAASSKAQSWLHPKGETRWERIKPQLFALSDILELPLPRWLDWLYVPLRPFFWLKRQIKPDLLRQRSIRSYHPADSHQSPDGSPG